jgi:hypothetical protein
MGVVSVTSRPRFSPGERTPGTHYTGGWVSPRAGLDIEAIGKILSPLPGIEPRSPGRPARSQTLYWLSYPAQTLLNYCTINCRKVLWLLISSCEYHCSWARIVINWFHVLYVYSLLQWRYIRICYTCLNKTFVTNVYRIFCNLVTFQVFTVGTMKMTALSDMAPCMAIVLTIEAVSTSETSVYFCKTTCAISQNDAIFCHLVTHSRLLAT